MNLYNLYDLKMKCGLKNVTIVTLFVTKYKGAKKNIPYFSILKK